MPTGKIMTMARFANTHREILHFERAWWKYAGAKDAAIREQFEMSSTRYYQLLNWIIDQPAALEHDAQTVNRLRRLRDQRIQARAARRDGFDIAAS